MKYTIFMILLFFLGCASTEYKQFVKKYHSDQRYYCKDGFLLHEKITEQAEAPVVSLVNSDICYQAGSASSDSSLP
jgi:hypothetical protein